MLGVQKTFSLQGESGVGGMVDFNITVKNDGNVDLVDVALTDAMFQDDGGERSVATKGVSSHGLYVTMEGFRFFLVEITVRSISHRRGELSVKYMLYLCCSSIFQYCRCLFRLLWHLPGDVD